MVREAPNKQTRGDRAYREMIARGEREAASKNLPFNFSKPPKPLGRCVSVWCPTCGTTASVTKTTIMVGCPKCNVLYDVTSENSSY